MFDGFFRGAKKEPPLLLTLTEDFVDMFSSN